MVHINLLKLDILLNFYIVHMIRFYFCVICIDDRNDIKNVKHGHDNVRKKIFCWRPEILLYLKGLGDS